MNQNDKKENAHASSCEAPLLGVAPSGFLLDRIKKFFLKVLRSVHVNLVFLELHRNKSALIRCEHFVHRCGVKFQHFFDWILGHKSDPFRVEWRADFNGDILVWGGGKYIGILPTPNDQAERRGCERCSERKGDCL